MKSLYGSRMILAFFAILGATLIFHSQALNTWWCCDDTQILKHAFGYSPWEYFFEPEAWRALIPSSLTPWLAFSYDLDLALFGFAPQGFYAHNLLSITLCAWLLFLVAREWVSGWPALGGSFLFLVGSPITVASNQLMVRHYVEGLLFYLLALWLIIRDMRSEHPRRHGLLAGVAYAIAASAKEVYLPLGFIPLLLPLGSFRQRLSVAWPLLLVMGLYVPWRWYMLGDAIGGYTPAEDFSVKELWTKIGQFALVPGLLWSHANLALAGIGLVFALALARAGEVGWKISGRMFTLLLLVLLPLLPLLRYPGIGAGAERYFIALWAALSLIFAIALGRACKGSSPWLHLLALVAFAAVTLPAHSITRRLSAELSTVHAVYRAQGKAIASLDRKSIIFVSPDVSSWFNTGMLDLRPAMGISSVPPLIVADEWELASQDNEPRRVLRYDPETRVMADISAQLPEMLARWREHLQSAPMKVKIEYDPGSMALRWQLDAGDGVRFMFIGPGVHLPIPSQGSHRVTSQPTGCFRIRADSAQGWIAYSAPLSWAAAENADQTAHLSWQGNGQLFGITNEPLCPSEAKPL